MRDSAFNSSARGRVLLVEDNPGDQRLIIEAFREANSSVNVVTANDGLEAFALLGCQEVAELPDLILLDLNMPRKDGKELLADLKGSPRFCHIPVVILTSSHSEKDVGECYSSRANGYVRKPLEVEELFALVKQIEGFWLNVVRLPARVGFA